MKSTHVAGPAKGHRSPPRPSGLRRPGRAQLQKQLKKIRCLLMDVDGVLTDGKLHFTSDGQEFKTFDVQDGHGIAMAHQAGLVTGFISGRASKATERRAADLGVKIVWQQPTDKMEMVEVVKRDHGFSDEEICFIGDELVDLPVLRRVGLAVAVPNAMDEVKAAAHYVTRRNGGDGAVREVIEMILKTQGTWSIVIAKYLTVIAAMLLVGCGDAPSASKTATPAATGYIEKFDVPERDPSGNLKWRLMGEKALAREDGTMKVFNAHAEFYTSNKVDMVMNAPTCLLDREGKRASSDGPVQILRAGMVLTGTGMDWSDSNATLSVHSNVRLEIADAHAALSTKESKP